MLIFLLLILIIVVDEFQNYLPAQIRILKSCVQENTKSMLYVGDLAQQTKLCTINNWDEIGETFAENRLVKLGKVYRHTKQILEYFNQIGYQTAIPPDIKDGPLVKETTGLDTATEIAYLKKYLQPSSEVVQGIIAKNEEYLQSFKNEFSNYENLHIFTINEAQGVEFDTVYLVGINKDIYLPKEELYNSSELIIEKKQVNKDLLYVALTRAMRELHLLGFDKIKDIVSSLN